MTPRFPDGLTVFDAYGQWLFRGAKEPNRLETKVLVMLHEDTPQRRADIEAIRLAWKQATGHQSVLWSRQRRKYRSESICFCPSRAGEGWKAASASMWACAKALPDARAAPHRGAAESRRDRLRRPTSTLPPCRRGVSGRQSIALPSSASMTASAPPRRWFVPGDLNGFFGLVVDNLSILGFIAAALIGIFRFPGRGGVPAHVPRHRARRAGRQPDLHLDGAPAGGQDRSRRRHRDAAGPGCADQHRHGAAGAGPAFVGFKQQGMDEQAAAIATWQLGMASLVVMGVLKLVLSFAGDAVTRACRARACWVPSPASR